MQAGAGGAGGAAGEAEGAGVADAVLLAPLTEDTFLHNLHLRYQRDLIYTYVGGALVSVNPCRALPLYSAELVRAYLARAPYLLPPHLYAVTAAAYRRVRDRGEPQCIVITGESGSGKTEAARVCLQCLVLAGGGGGAGARLTAAGTLLEAFGHAATARNHNASRVGKLLDVEFDFRGHPVGGHITHYLLEKERTTRVPEGERNYHVFYQLLAGADAALLKRLKLQRSWEQYRVLRAASPGAGGGGGGLPPGEGAAPPPAQADTDHFKHTQEALATLGVGGGERLGVLRLLAFLLKVGNLRFEPAHNIDGSLAARLGNHYELEEACALVGVCARELAAALGAEPPDHAAYSPEPAESDSEPAESETGTEGEGEGEGEAGWGWAGARRDRLLQELYERLFTYLVTAVNASIASGGRGARGAALGVLDMYGLEALARNALDALLINYAAERLQACVALALRRHQRECEREGLCAAAAPLPADTAADLLDMGPDSVLGVLREVSLPRGGASPGAAGLLARLQHRRHPRLRVLPPTHFTVVHFVGSVVYDARGMVGANRDWACARCLGVLARAREPLLRALLPTGGARGHAGHAHGSPGARVTRACRQRALLAALCRRLPPAPCLVRCLRAAAPLTPRRFDAARVRHQLHTQGIVEMALAARGGWCEAMSARALVARYGVLGGRSWAAGGRQSPGGASPARDPAVRLARRLLRRLPIPPAEFAFGRTKVFVRSPRTVWELEALRAARVDALVAAAQRAWRRHRARRQQRRQAHAQTVIVRAWRQHRARRMAAQGPEVATGRCRSEAAAAAAGVVWRAWSTSARRRYLLSLPGRLGARHRSPLAAWPRPPPQPRLLARTDRLLAALHHRWRCRLYRLAFDQTARNRMREKVTASALFLGRKALYARSVPHPFVGDYVRLRAQHAWRAHAGKQDRYVVFADLVAKVGSGSAVRGLLGVVSTRALLLLDARSLRAKRRVPAHAVCRLSLSPYADDLLCVHVHPGACAGAGSGGDSSAEEASQCSAAPADAAGCLFAGEGGGWRRRGDVLLRTRHVLELATKLFLVVQNACHAPPHVNIATQWEAQLGGAPVTVTFHAAGGAGGAGAEGGARLVRRGSRLDVLL